VSVVLVISQTKNSQKLLLKNKILKIKMYKIKSWGKAGTAGTDYN
jgi:hypothetical protein